MNMEDVLKIANKMPVADGSKQLDPMDRVVMFLQ